MPNTDYIDSPLGYTGNKYKLLPKLMPLFPDHVTTFYDAFCGGMAVSLNAKAQNVIANDVSPMLMGLYDAMRRDGQGFLTTVDNILAEYKVTPDNEDGYMRLREDFNKTSSPHKLFALIVTAYNSLFRFNSDGEYNAPFGFDKNTFNERKRENTLNLIKFLKGNVMLTCGSYDQVSVSDSDTFVYCDPPYLITNAAYNGTWNHVSEYALLRWLDSLNDRGVKFGLSNVLRHKGKYNRVLDDWSKRYTVHHLDYKYYTYAAGDKFNLPTDEVYICNY